MGIAVPFDRHLGHYNDKVQSQSKVSNSEDDLIENCPSNKLSPSRCLWGYNLTPYYWILEGPRLAVILVSRPSLSLYSKPSINQKSMFLPVKLLFLIEYHPSSGGEAPPEPHKRFGTGA